MTVVYLAVEGDADIPIAERLIRHVGLSPHRAIVARGASRLEQRIPGLVRSAAHINWEAPRSMGSSSEFMFLVIWGLDVEEAGIPALELRPERAVQHPRSGLKHQVCPAF